MADALVLQHADDVLRQVHGTPRPGRELVENAIGTSWTRCVNEYRLDPSRMYSPTVLDTSCLKELQTQHDELVAIADAEMESLYDQISGSGYALLLTDAVALPGEDDAPGDASHDTATHDTSRNKAPGAQALNQVAGTDDDLSRLMAKADSEMDEPEGSRRRRAIAHLRAAVKATKAEKEAGRDLSPRDHSEAYRDDLASVVRAVPGSAGDTDAHPREARKSTAPLKLVAEQRVDTPAPEPTPAAPEVAQEPAETAETTDTDTTPRAPVRPRRVSADRIDRDEAARAAAPVGSSKAVQGGFRDYAESVGATRLPEVLEAAAAYITFVEGHERFSRPMLMRMARDANEDDFSREIGLRKAVGAQKLLQDRHH